MHTHQDCVLARFDLRFLEELNVRTTITIAEDLLKKAQKLTGRPGYSEAIVTSIEEYVALKGRLGFLAKLFSKKTPHSLKTIKKQRRKGKWSL